MDIFRNELPTAIGACALGVRSVEGKLRMYCSLPAKLTIVDPQGSSTKVEMGDHEGPQIASGEWKICENGRVVATFTV